MTRPHSRYPNARWTDGVSSIALDKTLHHDSALTPTLLPTRVPAPAGTQVCVTIPTLLEKNLQLQGREETLQGDRASQGPR